MAKQGFTIKFEDSDGNFEDFLATDTTVDEVAEWVQLCFTALDIEHKQIGIALVGSRHSHGVEYWVCDELGWYVEIRRATVCDPIQMPVRPVDTTTYCTACDEAATMYISPVDDGDSMIDIREVDREPYCDEHGEYMVSRTHVEDDTIEALLVTYI
jgi:hypothetical protein